jgi:hypothetical protein
MLNFKLSLSKDEIFADELAKIKFLFKNNGDKVVHCLTYKFKTFWEDKTVDDFKPHEFFFNLNPNEEKEREFGEVNICKAYLAGNTTPNEYKIKVWIRYFVCGEEETQQVSNSIILKIKGKENEIEVT